MTLLGLLHLEEHAQRDRVGVVYLGGGIQRQCRFLNHLYFASWFGFCIALLLHPPSQSAYPKNAYGAAE